MYTKDVNKKSFKIIPERGVVVGEMPMKWVDDKDMKAGIKPLYKSIIRFLMGCRDLDTVKAVAYLDPKDTWDEKTGIEVCASKLELKNHLRLARAYDRVHRTLVEISLVAAEYCIRHTKKAMAIEDDLVRTYGRQER